ncbi:ADP-ribosylglycohydrolase [Propionicimonas paludicola]|uniref:ADP-ribosylglycohydrolase n=1 Tax=Propionicimonas paludicola TaxID=185243 RepID=A0A2A9CNG4_9ACTN|nr:ADP-ribosylglycohydrolase family protein [Propionicimonas paludicola]PFG15933.1 ADP-ribosylglycohydrolase [Propionicimonas paludicola]
MSAVVDRAAGCLAGLALGDAMGMPGELWVPQKIRDTFGWLSGFHPAPPGHEIVDGFRAGQVTDDTQQAFMLAATVRDAGGEVRAEDVARELVAWADRVNASAGNFLGPSSAKAIDLLRSGADPRSTGDGGETNGAAMRIAPIGIVRRPDDLDALVDAVVEATVMSHNTGVAVSGACLVAGVISAGIEGADLAEAVEVGMRAADLGRERGQQTVAAAVSARARLAIELAERPTSDQEFLTQLYDLVGAWVTTTESVPAALGLVARTHADPHRATELAANLGGDTDTIGAMAGAMCGSLSGLQGVPADMLAQLREVNGLDPQRLAAELVELRR